ncbi:topoisomerase II, partial [Burkholderia multivorans]
MGKKSKRSKEDLIAKRLARAQATAFVARPFEGLPFEADLICLRELVPAATAQVRLSEEYGGHEVTIASLLPAA